MNDSQKITEIHIQVVKLVEHVKNQNGKVKSNTERINKIEPVLQKISYYERIKSAFITFLTGTVASLITFIIMKR